MFSPRMHTMNQNNKPLPGVCYGPGYDQGPYDKGEAPLFFRCELPPHEGDHQWRQWHGPDKYELVSWPQAEEEK